MRMLSVIGGIWLLVLLVVGSDTGVDIIDLYVAQGVGTAIAIAWAVRTIASRRRQNESATPVRWPWVVVPAYLALVFVLFFLDGPRNPLFHARFRLSEAALTRDAERLLRSPVPKPAGSRRVGLFVVERTDVFDGQVRFITTSCAVIDSCGLVYSPLTEPTRWQEDVFTPLRGRWWHLMEGF